MPSTHTHYSLVCNTCVIKIGVKQKISIHCSIVSNVILPRFLHVLFLFDRNQCCKHPVADLISSHPQNLLFLKIIGITPSPVSLTEINAVSMQLQILICAASSKITFSNSSHQIHLYVINFNTLPHYSAFQQSKITLPF